MTSAGRLELPSGGTLVLDPCFLPDARAREVEARLRQELAWEQRAIALFGKAVVQPRLIAWAGNLPYRYSGQTLEPRPMPQLMGELTRAVIGATGVEFNHVLANRYRDGNDSMGYHADDEPELGEEPTVASLSFGIARRFVLRSRTSKREPPLEIMLGAGALVVMGGACQHRYRHGIPKQPALRAERISLTFRRLLSGPR
jgi:alkylated DNA repair dioxygenase AlkB